jgi:hypothetical protein
MLKRLSNIQFLALTLIISVIVLLSVMLSLYYYFVGRHQPIAIDSGPWGQFGDFFGGVLNPIISLVNMYLLYRIFRHESTTAERVLRAEGARHRDSLRQEREALRQEKERHKIALQEEENRHAEILSNSVIPWGGFRFSFINGVQVQFKNHGNGPLIIKSIQFKKDNVLISNADLKNLIPNSETKYGVSIKLFEISFDGSVISTNDEIILIEVSSTYIVDTSIVSIFNTWKFELSKFDVSITYSDIYNKEILSTHSLKQLNEKEILY